MNESPFLLYGRLDLGFGNPNKTAVFLATLVVASWGLAFWRNKFCWGLGLSAFFAVGLLFTYSREGIVAALCGLGIVLAWAPRPWPKRNVIAIGSVFLSLLILTLCLPKSPRLLQGLSAEDKSITNRLLVWKTVPHMILDAPDGWGLGRSGDAYMQWYQPIGRVEGYRTLVGSHFTWLVEFGWMGRIFYIALWTSIILLLWPYSRARWLSVAAGVWIALGIGAVFSSVLEAPGIWVLPAIVLFSVLAHRWRTRAWIGWPAGITGLVLACAVISLGIWSWGHIESRPLSICYAGGRVHVGSGSPGLWFVNPSREVLGDHYGQDVRAILLKQRTQGIQSSALIVPNLSPQDMEKQNCSIYIYSGKVKAPLPPDAERLIFLNAYLPPSFPWPPGRSGKGDIAILGSFVDDRISLPWKAIKKADPSLIFREIDPGSTYLPDWKEEILNSIASK